MVNQKQAPTMADVAKQVGVSTMTVSRALRPDSSVRAETRQKIKEAAERIGYVLDSTASGLSSRKTGFVAVTVPSINNANFADTVRGLSDQLQDTGQQILLGYSDYDTLSEEQLIEQLLRRRPEAIVVTGSAHTERCTRLLQNCGVPVIETWDKPDNALDSVVGFSNAEAGELMVRHFHDLGLRKLAFIGGGTSRDARGRDRGHGFHEALKEHGLDTSRFIAHGEPPITMADGAAAVRELLDRWPDTEAVMCVSDIAAFGALSECQRMGVSVPEGLAIGGFGNYDLGRYCNPALTTIDVGAYEIGVAAARMIKERISGSTEAGTAHEVPLQLLVRHSTGKVLEEHPG